LRSESRKVAGFIEPCLGATLTLLRVFVGCGSRPCNDRRTEQPEAYDNHKSAPGAMVRRTGYTEEPGNRKRQATTGSARLVFYGIARKHSPAEARGDGVVYLDQDDGSDRPVWVDETQSGAAGVEGLRDHNTA
jgi:hypothetical protein